MDNSSVFDTINQRFTSSIHVTIKRAEITLEEWQEIKDSFERQKNAALMGMDAAKRSAHSMEEYAKKLYAESNPEALNSERAMNEQLTREVERLEGRVEYLTEVIHSLQENA